MKRFLHIVFLIIAFACSVSATNTLSLSSVSGHPGDTVTVSVSLTTTDASTALQIDLSLSPYLTYLEGSAILTQSRVAAGHQLATSCKDDDLTILVYSTSNVSIPVGTGTLLTFSLILGREPASYPLLAQVVLSDSQANRLACAVTNGDATILASKISVSTKTIDYGHVPIRSVYTEQVQIENLGNETLHVTNITSSASQWSPSVTTLQVAAGATTSLTISYSPQTHGYEGASLSILSDAINGTQIISLTADPYSVNELYTSSASGNSSSEVTVVISMNNMEEIVAMQCAYTLPEGLDFVEGSVEKMSRANNHLVTGAVTDRVLNLYVYSLQNQVIAGNSGDVLQFRLALNGVGGNYPLVPQDVVLSNVSQVNMVSASSGGVVRIYSPLIVGADSLSFGECPIETPAVANYLVANTGETSLIINRIDFADTTAFRCTEVLPITVEAGSEANIPIQYTPTAEGEFFSTMQIYSNDPETKMLPVSLSGSVFESNYLSLSGSSSADGTSYTLNFDLHNTTEIVALQFDVQWETDFTTNPSSAVLTSRAGSHMVSLTNLRDGVYRVYIYSLQNRSIIQGEGDLLQLTYNIPTGVVYAGTHVRVNNIIMSTSSAVNYSSQEVLTYEVNSELEGDANGDGIVTVTDAIAVINYSLERSVPGFRFALADVNHDGRISVVDAVGIIQMIINN